MIFMDEVCGTYVFNLWLIELKRLFFYFYLGDICFNEFKQITTIIYFKLPI